MNVLKRDEFKQYSIEMLKYIDDFCVKNNIVYFLHAGTLLGAVRHQGFIPWDDDVDICMTRDEYLKFENMFPRNDQKYELQSLKTIKNYIYPYAKVRRKDTIKISMDTRRAFNPEEGLDIDIFIIDGYCKVELIKKIHFKIQNTFFRKVYLRLLYVYRENSQNRRKMINAHVAAWLVNWFASIFSFKKSKTAGCMVGLYRGKLEEVPSECFKNEKKHKFEDNEFPIPVEANLVLTSLYGKDYMTPPPRNKRVSTHSSLVMWKNTRNY